MDRRGLAETGGSALVAGALAAVGLRLFVGRVDWLLVVGVVAGVTIATAANYRARTGHAERVAAEAPGTERGGDPSARDGGRDAGDQRSR
ncbi:hypothetical protein [Haloarcula litorea]|uniref:hypothetical protein n=1 Tax=Haloarcula litorea TaxID=3032579 RepID=UPI0023E7B66F|nr:hypothetical protein [Halomicroarcula sp. GDY20]